MIAEHFHFYCRTQGSEESIADFVTGLQKLLIHSKFGGFLDDTLRDRFVRMWPHKATNPAEVIYTSGLTFSQIMDEAAKRDI